MTYRVERVLENGSQDSSKTDSNLSLASSTTSQSGQSVVSGLSGSGSGSEPRLSTPVTAAVSVASEPVNSIGSVVSEPVNRTAAVTSEPVNRAATVTSEPVVDPDIMKSRSDNSGLAAPRHRDQQRNDVSAPVGAMAPTRQQHSVPALSHQQRNVHAPVSAASTPRAHTVQPGVTRPHHQHHHHHNHERDVPTWATREQQSHLAECPVSASIDFSSRH